MESQDYSNELRKYLNKLGEMPQNEIPDYVNTLISNYDSHINPNERDTLVQAKENMENTETSFFSKKKSLERIARVFLDVDDDLNLWESWKFNRDFDF